MHFPLFSPWNLEEVQGQTNTKTIDKKGKDYECLDLFFWILTAWI